MRFREQTAWQNEHFRSTDDPTSQADVATRVPIRKRLQSGRTPPQSSWRWSGWCAPARNSHFRLPFRCTKNLDSCSVTRLNPLQLSLCLPTFILLLFHPGHGHRLIHPYRLERPFARVITAPRLPDTYAQSSQPLSCHHAGRPHQRHLADHAPASSLRTSFRIRRRLTASARHALTSSTILHRCSRSRLGSLAHPFSAITC